MNFCSCSETAIDFDAGNDFVRKTDKSIGVFCYVMVNIKHTIFQLSVNMLFIDSTWHSTMSRTTRLYIFLGMKNINQLAEHDLEYIL